MKINYVLTLVLSELKQVWNNKRFLVLLVTAPILISISFGFVSYRNPAGIDLTIYVEKPSGDQTSSEMERIISDIDNYTRDDGSKPFSVNVELNSQGDAIKRLDQGFTRAVVVLTQGTDGQLVDVKVTSLVGETTITNEIEYQLGQYFDQYSREVATEKLAGILVQRETISPTAAVSQANNLLSGVETIIGTDAWKDLRYFDFYASAMIVIGAVIMPLLLSVISITSERAKGTIERIFVSPYKKSEIIMGKVVAHSIFAALFIVLFIVTLKLVFNVTLGNIGLVMLLAFLVGITSSVLGLLVSSVTYSESESVIIGILGMLGIMALMTYMTPWETMHPVAKILSSLIPFTYGIQTIRQVNMVGAGFVEVWPNLVIIGVSIIGLLLISIPILRREVK